MKSTKLSSDGKKLVARLKADHAIELPADVVIRRTYAGHHQKSNRAWSWFFYSKSANWLNIGSCETVRSLVRCKKISVRASLGLNTELFIENGDY